jgi:hypothetical protein
MYECLFTDFMSFHAFLQCFIADRSVSSAPTVQGGDTVGKTAQESRNKAGRRQGHM